VPGWLVFADTILQREALLWRLGSGVAPRDLAGWYVTGEDVGRVLSTLPGLDGAAPPDADTLRAQLDPDLARAHERLDDEMSGDSRFAQLVRAARLGRTDAEVLAVLVAVELSPPRQRLVGYLHDDVRMPRITHAMLGRLVENARCAPDSTLVRLGLVEPERAGVWATRALTVPDRVLWHLQGDDSVDPLLPDRCRIYVAPADPIRSGADRSGPGGDGPANRLVLVHGADRETRLRQAGDLLGGQELLVSGPPAGPEAALALLREAVITRRAITLELDTPLRATDIALVERSPEVSWVLSSSGELPLEDVPQVAWREVRCRDQIASDEDWRQAIGRPGEPGHQLDREQLRLVGTALAAGTLTVPGAVRRLAAGHLDGLALRTTPTQGWPDLILPTDQLAQLRELASRYRGRSTVYGTWGFSSHPSTGIVALFSGQSGTGKTLAAEVIAGELGLDLYKVDLSAVVSKYIGETEKNLNKIFDAARAAEVVLFFDEADALFGKRSEVSDAHDRYANIEVAYLLQRLEAHDGVVIMATNLQRNIDAAFLRRISVAVDFPSPDERHRRAIWAQHFPVTAPMAAPEAPGGADPVDLDFLAANFAITGGMIRNAVIGSAFLAAAEGSMIGMEQVIRSVKREFQKAGRLQTEVEFDRYYHLIADTDDAHPDDPQAALPEETNHVAAAR